MQKKMQSYTVLELVYQLKIVHFILNGFPAYHVLNQLFKSELQKLYIMNNFLVIKTQVFGIRVCNSPNRYFKKLIFESIALMVKF